jgi:hypothetical protein
MATNEELENLEAFRTPPWTEALKSLPDFMFDVCEAVMKNGIAHATDPWGYYAHLGPKSIERGGRFVNAKNMFTE